MLVKCAHYKLNGSHIKYEAHNCSEGRSDHQVPICPLCNKPVAMKKDDSPDAVVSQHLDRSCDSIDAINQRRIYLRRCAVKGCKRREAVSIQCAKCKKEFCIRHRLEADHNCKGQSEKQCQEPRSRLNDHVASEMLKDLQGDLDYDDALAFALALSLDVQNRPHGSAETDNNQTSVRNKQPKIKNQRKN